MMTARKKVGSMPTHHLAMRHSVDYSSSDHFSSDDSSSSSSSSSSSKTSSDSSADALSDSASSHSSSDHSLPASPSGTRSSHHLCSGTDKRSRSPVASVPLSSPTLRALSYARAGLLPSPKRIRSPKTATDLEGCLEDSFEPYVPREAGLGVDFEDGSFELSRSRRTDLEMNGDVERSDGIEIDLEVQAEIDECIAYADALRDRGIDARIIVEAIDREEIETDMRGPVEVRVDRVTHPVVADDIPEPTQEGAVEVTYETLGDLVQRFHDHTKEIPVRRVQLERDNRRLRDIMDVKSQRVTRFRHSELRVRCLTHDLKRQGHVRESTSKAIAEWQTLRVRDAVRNLGPLMGDEGEQKVNRNERNGNRGNGNGGNGNGNGNRGGNGYNFRGFMPARECTYQDFLKCQPLSFNGIEGVVGLTRRTYKVDDRSVMFKKRGLKDGDRGNLIAAEPTKLQDAIRIANNLMDQKLKGYARSAENNRRLDNNPRDNRGQQPVFKRQNVGGQNVARAYTAGNNEKKGVGHITRDCTTTVTPNTQRAPIGNQLGIVCYECGRPGHFRKDCPKLRNQNHGNKTRNKNGNKSGNQTGGSD
ncbi:putative reverse transcriptase domain-containing protein [Tanacetum coccineum]